MNAVVSDSSGNLLNSLDWTTLTQKQFVSLLNNSVNPWLAKPLPWGAIIGTNPEEMGNVFDTYFGPATEQLQTVGGYQLRAALMQPVLLQITDKDWPVFMQYSNMQAEFSHAIVLMPDDAFSQVSAIKMQTALSYLSDSSRTVTEIQLLSDANGISNGIANWSKSTIQWYNSVKALSKNVSIDIFRSSQKSSIFQTLILSQFENNGVINAVNVARTYGVYAPVFDTLSIIPGGFITVGQKTITIVDLTEAVFEVGPLLGDPYPIGSAVSKIAKNLESYVEVEGQSMATLADAVIYGAAITDGPISTDIVTEDLLGSAFQEEISRNAEPFSIDKLVFMRSQGSKYNDLSVYRYTFNSTGIASKTPYDSFGIVAAIPVGTSEINGIQLSFLTRLRYWWKTGIVNINSSVLTDSVIARWVWTRNIVLPLGVGGMTVGLMAAVGKL